MKAILLLILACYQLGLQSQSLSVEPLAELPMRTSNNAVVEGFGDGKAYVYSFGGIDETKIYTGIHLRSFRLDVEANVWSELDPLPDDRGKIASSASRVGDIIYIIGGYHVAANGTEESSSKVHRFDIVTNKFLSDGADIPTAIDDQVQVVRGDFIYVITGWSNTQNVPLVQVYNTVTDTWDRANILPNNNSYKVFGSSGTIIGDTIYYYGGAGGSGFDARADLRQGIISSVDPLRIEWSLVTPMTSPTSYRNAASSFNGQPFWFGGSEVSYNFNGIAYNGSGGVEPSGRAMRYDLVSGTWDNWTLGLPMDLRSVAELSGREKVIVGGMVEGQSVTNQVWKVLIDGPSAVDDITTVDYKIWPNPIADLICIEAAVEIKKVSIVDSAGRIIKTMKLTPTKYISIDASGLAPQSYFIEIEDTTGKAIVKSFVKK